jgi:TPR repeat protein
MMLTRGHHCTLVLSAAACYALLIVPANAASPGADPNFSSTHVAPEPRTVADEVKLANDYLAGRGVKQDLKMAAYWYEKAAGTGDPGAQFEIGYLYETGVGVDKNPERAAHWYQLAASSGMLLAKVNLGIAYLWGAGVPKNEGLAFELINEAAAKGNGRAACYLGDFYAFGIGVPQDSLKAEQWYRKGARRRDPIAEFDLASMLMNADDSQHELPTAAKLLRHSAAAGYVSAMHALGLLLVRNPNLAHFSGEAVSLLNDAADAGNWRSSVLLGVLARDGNLVPVDNAAAYYHFRVAALQGGEEANRLVAFDLRLLSAKLGDGRAQAIDFQANQWRRQHHFILEFDENKGKNRTGSPSFAVVDPPTGTHAAEMLTSPTN